MTCTDISPIHMLLLPSSTKRLESNRFVVEFPSHHIEQLHLKIHPINTPKVIHVLVDNGEVGYVACQYDETKIYKKKIKLDNTTSSIILHCEAYNDFVDFLEIQVYGTPIETPLPIPEEPTQPLLPSLLETCTLVFPRPLLLDIAGMDFPSRHEALNTIIDLAQTENEDMQRCVSSLLTYLATDNRPKIVLQRIALAQRVSDVVHLDRILENAYDYQSYIQKALVKALVNIKLPLSLLLKSKPKLVPICLDVLLQANYKPSLQIAEYTLQALKTQHRPLAMTLWSSLHPHLATKDIVDLSERLIENSRLRALVLQDVEGVPKPSTPEKSMSRSASRKLMSKCVFCDNAFPGDQLDRHYFECPMLMICNACDQILEVCNYAKHCKLNHKHVSVMPYVCPFCGYAIEPENDVGWRLHLDAKYAPDRSEHSKIPVRRTCTHRRVHIE